MGWLKLSPEYKYKSNSNDFAVDIYGNKLPLIGTKKQKISFPEIERKYGMPRRYLAAIRKATPDLFNHLVELGGSDEANIGEGYLLYQEEKKKAIAVKNAIVNFINEKDKAKRVKMIMSATNISTATLYRIQNLSETRMQLNTVLLLIDAEKAINRLRKETK